MLLHVIALGEYKFNSRCSKTVNFYEGVGVEEVAK